MLTRILILSKIALCLALASLCVIGGIFSFQLRRGVIEESRKLDATVVKLDASLDMSNAAIGSLNQTFVHLNQPCGHGPCGTLADIAKTLNTVRLTAGQIEIAADHENRRLSILDDQEATLFADSHRSLLDLDTGLKSANIAIEGLQPVTLQAATELAELQKATANLDALISDPNARKTLDNVQVTTKSLSGMAVDTQEAWHNYLHPKWPARVWGYVSGVGLSAAKLFIP